MRYMFDTNICIHLIQQQPQGLIQRCEALAYGDVVLSSIVLAELSHGVERHASQREQAKAALNAMLSMFPVMPFGDAAAHAYGRLCAAVPDRRRDALDRLIAAHAVSLDLALVTNNQADFLDYPGLRLDNWVSN
jgi:tRNA(fMet)-specific endonuclease VapC